MGTNTTCKKEFYSILLSLVLISCRPTCDVVAGCKWQRSAICPSGSPAHLRWIADLLKFARNANRIVQFLTILPVNMDRMVSLEYVAYADDVHIKYFHRRQPPTTADNRWLACEVELSSTSQQSGRSMPGIDYDSAINVHICRNGVPGMSAAHENQALPLLAHLLWSYFIKCPYQTIDCHWNLWEGGALESQLFLKKSFHLSRNIQWSSMGARTLRKQPTE